MRSCSCCSCRLLRRCLLEAFVKWLTSHCKPGWSLVRLFGPESSCSDRRFPGPNAYDRETSGRVSLIVLDVKLAIRVGHARRGLPFRRLSPTDEHSGAGDVKRETQVSQKS
uniref:Uncharacterized protein n=1 Tax=Chromera velia CCMP2878 TaxID=1169474 RepID=A0A0G4H132_9ALVE|eukprot:Cvel_24225.t1-p1 / transcript=Cvel_24225.t1 / gene=Cvel_24225 / organism=Chromera_velia_CCMP2878 / gene_product=hypothetical protein / transcript_product=hypothetical protein / location=Cvel_scaffold2590:19888-21303(+) / protein_length=110 / sequence_SO=supercontig / SO=protein_coding / is_pseudo=false